MIIGKPHRTLWCMPRGAYAIKRGVDIVAIGWLRIGDLDHRYRPGDTVLLSPATLTDLDAADGLPAVV